MKVIFLLEDRMLEKDSCHKYLKEVFNFSDYYGHNLDALYDELSSLKDIEIIFIKTDISSSYLNKVKKVFNDIKDNTYLKIINLD